MVKFASPSCVCFISFGFLLATICVWVWMVCSLHSVTTGSRDRANVSLIMVLEKLNLNLLLFLTFSALVANPKKSTLHGGQSRSWCAEINHLVSRDRGSAVPSRVSLLTIDTEAESINSAYSWDPSRFPRRRPCVFIQSTAIG